MPSTYTTNKSIEKPASGSYSNAWAAPVNADWDDIDNALGGHSTISVTGVGAGTIALTLPQYQPPNIEFTGTLSGNLVYALPSGIGGLWSVSNGTTGTFTLTFAVTGGGTYLLPQGQRSFIVCDGTNLSLAQAPTSSFTQLTDSIATGQVPVGAVTQWQASLSIAFTQLTGVASLAQIPSTAYRNTALGSGNAIVAQSGGTPSGGVNGDIILIY